MLAVRAGYFVPGGRGFLDDDTFDPLWVFAYEALDATELKGDWVALKKAKISFVKQTW